MPSNTTSDGTAPVVRVDKSVEIALYDAMPRRWRVLIDGLPILQQVAKIEEYRRTFGDDAAYARIVDSFSRQFPGWRPPETEAPIAITSPRFFRRPPRGAIRVPTSD